MFITQASVCCAVVTRSLMKDKHALSDSKNILNMWKVIHLFMVFTTIASRILNDTTKVETSKVYSFAIDYENDQFLLDGEPFRYISGSFHYFRTPKKYWRNRLRKLRAAGLNAVSTYVEWSLHEPEPGLWNWNGEADISEFFEIAQKEDILVLLRPGPYICAERDFGGFPAWLLSLTPEIKLRTNDYCYMKYVEKYLKAVLTRVKPYLRGYGGPVIMVQVENEYGSFNACDVQYRNSLRNIFNQHIGSNAVLYTTDGPQDSMLRCGVIPGVFATVDFGTSSNATANFQVMRKFQPRGPLVNSEFYPGWLTHWEEPFQSVATIEVVKALDELLATGASVNIYMFYGGTNFGFTAGANTDPEYRPQLTSYDYDAPLTEAGDPTPKYFAMRDVIANYLPLPELPIPKTTPKTAYGTIIMEPIIRLFDPLARSLLSSIVVQRKTPPTFEELQVPLQLVLYETNFPMSFKDPAILEAVVHDRAYVYTDAQLTGILSRSHKIFSLPLKNSYKKHLALLVENQGHINYGNYIKDYKGLWNVTVNKNQLSMWNVTGFRLNNIQTLHGITNGFSELETLYKGPVFLRGKFSIKETPTDTFLDTTGWGKGVAYINGYNLGRYWPLAGPQKTLYVPGSFLNKGVNEIIILELEYVLKSRSMEFQNAPKLNFSTLYESIT